jgi:NADH-quinone oxidoreductase subunit G
MTANAPHFAQADLAPQNPGANPAIWGHIGVEGKVDATKPLAAAIHDFYLTNPVARASETMAECSRTYIKGGAAAAAE